MGVGAPLVGALNQTETLSAFRSLCPCSLCRRHVVRSFDRIGARHERAGKIAIELRAALIQDNGLLAMASP